MATYAYSLIQYVPDPVRNERLNVGVLLVGVTFVPNAIHTSGWLYGVVAAVSGASFLYLAWRLYGSRDTLGMKRVKTRTWMMQMTSPTGALPSKLSQI